MQLLTHIYDNNSNREASQGRAYRFPRTDQRVKVRMGNRKVMNTKQGSLEMNMGWGEIRIRVPVQGYTECNIAVLRGAEVIGGVVKRLFKVLGGVEWLKVQVGCTRFISKRRQWLQSIWHVASLQALRSAESVGCAWILSRIVVERPQEYASSKVTPLKLVLPAKISNCAMYSSANLLNDILRSCSLVHAVLEWSGSPNASLTCFMDTLNVGIIDMPLMIACIWLCAYTSAVPLIIKERA